MNKLVLYDDTDQKILFSENKIGEGAYGIVYKQDDNTCIKRIKCKYDKYDLECLKLIKELNLKEIYKIIRFLYHINGNFAGYQMQYYPEENIDMTTIPSEYTIENLKKILKTIKILTSNKIYTKDLGSHNMRITSNGIIIIDIDQYYFSEGNNLENANKVLAYLSIKGLLDWCYYFYNHKNNNEDIRNVTRNLFETYDYDTIAKTLSKYKYPIDYIKSKIK